MKIDIIESPIVSLLTPCELTKEINLFFDKSKVTICKELTDGAVLVETVSVFEYMSIFRNVKKFAVSNN